MKKYLVFILLFSTMIFVFGEKIAEYDEIYKPRQIVVSGKDLYVVDGAVINKFSINDQEYLKQISRKGEGPGEFKFWPQIAVFKDIVFVTDRISFNKKIVFFTRDGDFLNERKLPLFTSVKKVKMNYLSREYKLKKGERDPKINVRVLDNKMNIIKELYSEENPYSNSEPDSKKVDFELFPKVKFALTDGVYIYIVNTFKGFYIEIYDHNGNILNTIKKNVKKVKFEGEYKKKVLNSLKKSESKNRTGIKYNYIFPEYLPEISDLKGDNNKIYVTTYRELNKKSEIIVLDMNGNTIKTCYVPKARFSNIHDGKFYYLVDNEEDEVWELHSVNL